MITISEWEGDLTTSPPEFSLIVHQVNPMVLGPVLAKALSDKYPRLGRDFYKKASGNPLVLGEVQLVLVDAYHTTYVANACGQLTTKYGTNNTDYQAVLNYLISCCHIAYGLNLNLFVPKDIGCGMAGGSKEAVEAVLETVRTSVSLDVDIKLVTYKRYTSLRASV